MHRSGKHMNRNVATARRSRKESSYETGNASTIQVADEWSLEELNKSQKKDRDLKLIRNWVKNGVQPTWQEVSRYGTTIKGYWAQWSSLCLRDGLLHRKWESPDGVSAVHPQSSMNPPSVRRTAQQFNWRTFWSKTTDFIG
ncbi:hypothetical protein NQ318_011842 [Aromia moschata]|uniref:Uncharacterized protein n=1 Tax=Aromia moschata TaxID=1265417 RepID=A0AAV8XED9_9CUCU|nr:hypothetical protein NQ318_011842 [Aromia moschata]